MKNQMPFRQMTTSLVAVLCFQIAPVLVAQDSALPPANPGAASTASATETRPVHLSSGTSDILKLARARVSD
jgi:hypothetical protein